MKQLFLLLVSLSLTIFLPAQVSKTVNVTAGGLSMALTAMELSTITNMTLTGTINAVDIETIQNYMPLLTELDLSQTAMTATTYYRANWFPGPTIWKNSGNLGGLRKPHLTSLQLPSKLEVIGSGGLSGCSGLTSLTIPSSVTSIGTSAFAFCSGLTSLVLPASIESIGNTAFMTCENLASIYSYRLIPLNTANSFYDAIKSTCILYVPFGSKALYAAVDEWKGFKNIVEMPEFKLFATRAILEAKQGSTATVELTSNVTWTASCDQAWLSVNPTSGTGSHTLTFTAQANTTATDRIARITVSAASIDPKTIVITQQTMPTGVNETEQDMAQFKCYPNPFTRQVAIEIQNPEHTKITVDIYNMAGQRVKILAIGSTDEQLNLIWNGINERGQRVPPGVYICKINGQSKQLIFEGR